MEDINFFSTNEDLKNYIHNIHNFLRNNGFGYGQNALKIFSVFYGLRLIEDKLKDTKFGFSKEEINTLSFSKIYKKSKKDVDDTFEVVSNAVETLYDLFHEYKNGNKTWRTKIGFFIFSQIPRDLRDEVWYKFLTLMSKIPVGYNKNRKVNLSGKVWEYFIGRDKTAISELGAYFSDRHITNFCFDKVNPVLDDDNNVKTMIDMFGGSGGFTLGYANYLNTKYDNIDWSKNIDNIYHIDMEMTVVKMTALELFAITGYLPEYDNGLNFYATNSFKYESFKHEGNGTNKSYKTYDYIFTNPPYGGDKSSKNANQDRTEILITELKSDLSNYDTKLEELVDEEDYNELKKMVNKLNITLFEKTEKYDELIDEINKKSKKLGKNVEKFVDKMTSLKSQIIYWEFKIELYKQEEVKNFVNLENCSKVITNFAKENKIDVANDKESCSLLLSIALLKPGGTCCAVLKEGVFFDSKYAKLRKMLVDNYNVTDVISVPQNAFENTSTKTSIIIFHNNGKTKKINFASINEDIYNETIFDVDKEGTCIKVDIENELIEIDDNKRKTILENFSKINFSNVKNIDKIKGEFKKEMIYENICSATYKQISEPVVIKSKGKKSEDRERYDYSLNYKNYKDFVVYCPDGYELKKLGDLVEIKYGKRITKDKDGVDKNSEGAYPVYGGGNITFYTNKYNREGISYVISRFGISETCVRIIDSKIFLNDGAFTIHNKNNILEAYIGLYLFTNQNIVYDCCTGSCQKGTDIDLFKNIKIPIPKDIKVMKKQLEKLQKLHQEITETTELIPQKEKSICELIEKLTNEGSSGVDYDEFKLSDVCEIPQKLFIGKFGLQMCD